MVPDVLVSRPVEILIVFDMTRQPPERRSFPFVGDMARADLATKVSRSAADFTIFSRPVEWALYSSLRISVHRREVCVF